MNVGDKDYLIFGVKDVDLKQDWVPRLRVIGLMS